MTFGRRTAATGWAAGWVGGFSAAAGLSSGGLVSERRRAAAKAGAGGQKSRTREGFRGSRGPQRCRGPGQKRAQPGLFPGRAGQKPGGSGAKRGVRAGENGGYGGCWGQKSPFLPRKRLATGLCWGEAGGESWRGVKGYSPRYHQLRAVSAEKEGGFGKAFSRAYRKKPVFSPFLCRWRTVNGGDSLVYRSGCYFGRKE